MRNIFLFLMALITVGATAQVIPHGKEVTVANHLQFVANKNQWSADMLYKSDIGFGHVYYTKNAFRFIHFSEADLEAVHELKHGKDVSAYENYKVNCYAYEMQFVNANTNAVVSGSNKLDNYYNYFLGNNQSKWASNVPAYKGVNYTNLYTGVDVQAYGQGASLKYDVIVHPTANIGDVKIKYNGIEPTVNAAGNLVLNLGFNTIVESLPITYQIINGQKIIVACKYKINKKGEITFETPDGYNKNYDVVIDPILIFATYSSGGCTTYGFSATYDNNGSLYAGGECFAIGWPVSTGAFQTTFGGAQDCGINKYNPLGTAIIYSTYYGGSGTDYPNNLVTNANNELAMTGSTSSSNLPTSTGCYSAASAGGTDAYVVHFNAAGTAIIGSTYIGGSGNDAQNSFSISPNYGDSHRGEIFFDTNNDIIVATSTSSTNFPMTAGAYQSTNSGGQDGIYFKLNSNCSQLLRSTYLGGSGDDACFSIVKNSLGNWIIAGGTNSTNFPTTVGAYQTTNAGGTEAFVTVLNNFATGIVNSTYLGTTSFDHGFKVQTELADTIYVCGQTDDFSNFPVTPGSYSNANSNIFFAKFSPNLSTLVLSTRIGGPNLIPNAFLKDNCGNLYFSGFGASSGLPLTTNAHQTAQGGLWLGVLDVFFTTLVYATYMGAAGDHVDGGTSRFDPLGIVYQSVCTSSSSNYSSPGAVCPTKVSSASWDVASFKFDFQFAGADAILAISPNDSGCAPYTVNFSNGGSAGTNFVWYFGNGDSSTLPNPVYTYTTAGAFNVIMVAYNPTGCITSDTAYTSIKVLPAVNATFDAKVGLGCIDDTVSFWLLDSILPTSTTVVWLFGDGSASTTLSPKHLYITQGIYTITAIVNNFICADTFKRVININHPIDAQFTTANALAPRDSFCLGDSVKIFTIGSIPQFNLNYYWDMGNGVTFTTGPGVFSYAYQQSGTYTISLLVRDTLGCEDSIQHMVYIDEPPYVNVSINQNSFCTGDPLYPVDTVSPYTLSYNYNFGDGTQLWNNHNPSYAYTNSGVYTITLTGYYRVCNPATSTQVVTINDYPTPNLGADSSICAGLTGAIVLDPNATANTYSWSTGTTGTTYTATTPGLYWVTLANGNCITADTLNITNDCYLNIPKAFTPNNNGNNEYWLPLELLSKGITAFSLSIYNRWGEKVFETTNTNGRGWDGKYGGKDQPMGTYIYTINATFKNGRKDVFNGNFILIR